MSLLFAMFSFSLIRTKLACFLICLTLSACGGGGGDSGAPGNGDNPTQLSALDVEVSNLQGSLTLFWHDQEIVLIPGNSSGSFTSPNTERATVTYNSPLFQNCNSSDITIVNNTYTAEIRCSDPDIHFLSLSSTGLRQPMEVAWGRDTLVLDIDTPSGQLSAVNAELEFPTLLTVPSLQSCTTALSDHETDFASFAIECADLTAITNVLLPSPLPFPVEVGIVGQTALASSSDVVFPSEASRLEELQITEGQGNQACDLAKGDYRETENEQDWSLSCNEFVVHVNNQLDPAGVYIAFDNGDELLLEAGSFSDEQFTVVSFHQNQFVISQSFGVRRLGKVGDSFDWQTSTALPEWDLNEYWSSDNAVYLNYSNSARYQVYRIESDGTVRMLLDAEPPSLTEPVIASIIPVSYNQDIVAVETFTVNELASERSISYYTNGTINGISRTAGNNANPTQWLRDNDGNDFLIQINDIDDDLEVDQMAELYFVAGSQSISIARELDTEVSAATWSDSGGNERVWLVGDDLDPNSPKTNQLVELSVNRDGNNLTFNLETLENFSSTNFGYIGADKDMLILTQAAEEREHGVAAMFIDGKTVEIEALADALGVSSDIRTHFSRELITRSGGLSEEYFLTRPTIVNGWTLFFSGVDSDGDIWITNGHAEDSMLVASASWEEFQQYELYFAGKAMAHVKDDSGSLIKFH